MQKQQAKDFSTWFESNLRLVYYDRQIFSLFPSDLFLNLSLTPLP